MWNGVCNICLRVAALQERKAKAVTATAPPGSYRPWFFRRGSSISQQTQQLLYLVILVIYHPSTSISLHPTRKDEVVEYYSVTHGVGFPG